MSYYEIIGFATGLICVYLNARQNIWGWPIAMVSVAMYSVVFFNTKLYGDMALQGFFFVLICYGLFEWQKKDSNAQSIQPTFCSLKSLTYGIAFTAFFTGILAGLLDKFTDSDVPFLDGFTTAMSIVAQVLLARKKIENWIYWILADVVYVGLYTYKGLYLTAILYGIFIPLAIYGYWEWHKQIKKRQIA